MAEHKLEAREKVTVAKFGKNVIEDKLRKRNMVNQHGEIGGDEHLEEDKCKQILSCSMHFIINI